MNRSGARVSALLFGAIVALSPLIAQPVAAAVSLTVTPITWDIVGLDSNSPATGPYRFPVGARICAAGGTASAVTATLDWDSANPHIGLRPGSLGTVDLGSLAPGACADAYFEAEVTRTSTAYDTTREYHITATDSGSSATAHTPRPRQLYVEHLISQNRNGITSVKLDGTSIPAGGSMTLVVGRTYDIELAGYTATQGYNQLEAFMTLPNTIFQVLGVDTTYSADTSPFVSSPTDRLYADACGWDSDPNSPNYRSCIGGDGKAGGTVVTTYHVRVVAGAGTSQTLTSLLYDFSGSSFHYNADAGVGARIASIVGPGQVTIRKAFSPKAIAPGSTSTLAFTLANPTSATYGGVHFTDVFPAGLAVAGSPGVTTSGCGAGAFSPALAGGETSVTFAGATLAPNGECRVTVAVTAPAGTYPNTTGHLFIDTDTDTGNTAADTLVAQAAAACVPGQTLAAWTVPDGTTANPPDLAGGLPTTKAAAVSTATALATVPASTGIVTTSGSGDTTSWRTWGYKNANQRVDFTVDTRKFSGVSLGFAIANPGGANGPNQFTVATSTGGAFTTRLTVNAPAAAFTQHTLDLTGLTSTTGNTTIRISGSGANNDQNGANLDLDNIQLTGCLESAPAPTVTKVFAPDPIAVGATSTLTFTISNGAAGSVDLTGVAISDVLPEGLAITGGSGAACGGTLARTAASRTIQLTGGSLAAGGTCTFDVPVRGEAAGQHQNVTGFLSTTESGASTSYATDSLLVVAPPVLGKGFTPPAIRTGATSQLAFTIANPNRTTGLSGIGFTDTLPAGVTVQSTGPAARCGGSLTTTAPSTIAFSGGSLAANDACSFAVTVTGSTPGSKVNTTSTISSAEGGSGAPADATLSVTDLAAALDLTKQASTDGVTWRTSIGVAEGADVYYRFAAYNAGDVALDTLAVDDGGPVACAWTGGAMPLVPGDTAFCVVGPVKALEGTHPNTATASASSSLGAVTSGASTATYATTGLTLVKTADEAYFTSAGDILHYTFGITNSGFFALAGPVTVSDDKAADESCPSVTTVGDLDRWLDPGETITCDASYAVNAADVTAKVVTNTASATVDGVVSPSDDASVSLAALTLDKSAAETVFTAAGDILHYTFGVTNSGSARLAGPVTIADDLATDETCPAVTSVGNHDTTFDPGESLACTANYTVTAADVSARHVTNTATASAAGVTSSDDQATVDLARLSIAKASTETSVTHAGQVVPYTITVTNTGGTTLTGLKVTDTRCDAPPVQTSGDVLNDGIFAVDEAWVFECSHTVTQAEINLGGNVSNTATADSAQTEPTSGTTDIPVTQSPALDVAKTTTTVAVTHAGQVVPFTITARNAGNVDLTAVLVQDPQCDASPVHESGDTSNPGVLDVGETWTYTCSRTMTQPDIDSALAGAGLYRNSASVRTAQTGTLTAHVDVPVASGPALSITKTSTTTTIDHVGQVVPYVITVTNTGNVPLAGMTVSDPLCGTLSTVSDDSIAGTLHPGGVLVLACNHTVTLADMDAGGTFTNTATADTDQTAPQDGTFGIPVLQRPALTLAKTVTETSFAAAGNLLHYGYLVTNTGTTSLSGPVTVDDDTVAVTCPPTATLAPDAAVTCTATYTVQPADVIAGHVTNVATASASGPDGLVTSPADSVTVNRAAVTISKTAAPDMLDTPATIRYTITVRNAGGVPLTGVTVTDALAGGATLVSGDTASPGVLDVGEAWLYSADYAVTQADIDAGDPIVNTATVVTDQAGPASDDATTTIEQRPSLAIVKSLTGGVYFTKVGDILTYGYLVTNTGNITIPGPITVTDNRTEVDCPPVAYLAPGASITCTSRDTVTSADLRAGKVTNTALASATVGREVVASSEVAVTAYRVIPPSAPPSTAADGRPGATSTGWGLVGVFAMLGIGLLASALVLATARRRRRGPA